MALQTCNPLKICKLISIIYIQLQIHSFHSASLQSKAINFLLGAKRIEESMKIRMKQREKEAKGRKDKKRKMMKAYKYLF